MGGMGTAAVVVEEEGDAAGDEAEEVVVGR